MDVEVMPDGFTPRRRGRKPSYDISDVLAGLAANPGHWVKFTLGTAEGKSAHRQLTRMKFDVAMETPDQSKEVVVVYVRSQS